MTRDLFFHIITTIFFTDKLLLRTFLTEVMALRDGLRVAWEQGCRRLICESDCLELVRNLANVDWVSMHSHGGILREIRDMMGWSWKIDISWIAIEGNMVADWLAKRGSSLVSSGIHELALPPPELKILLLKDSLGVS